MRLCAALGLSLVLFALPAFAADDPLGAFPADTGVVLRIGGPATTSGKVKGFLNNAAPRYANVSDSLGPALGSLVGNPTLAGIDANRDWYVAVFARADKRPAIVFAVPTSNADELKKAVGKSYTFADFENWVIYSLDAEAVGKVTAADRNGSVGTVLTERLKQVFDKGEMAVLLNVPALRETYRAQIDAGKDQLIKAATQAPPGVETSPTIKMGQEYNRRMIEEVMKVIDDSTAIVKSLSISDDALRVEALAVVNADSEAGRFLAKQSPTNLPLLQKLPGGRLAYYDLAGDFSRLVSLSSQMTLASYPMNEKLQSLSKELSNVKFREFAGAAELGDLQDGVIHGISLVDVASPEDYRKLVRRIVEAIGTTETGGIKQEMTVKPDAETIEGVKTDVVHVNVAATASNESAQSAEDMMQILFGKDGMTQRLAVVDGLFVQGLGEQGVMASGIKAVRAGQKGEDAASRAVAAARKGLDRQANLLVLVDLPRLLGGGLQLAVQSKKLPLPIDPQAIDNMNLAPSYAGMTVKAEQDAARFQVFIPVAQVKGIVDVLNVVQKAAPPRDRAN
jgi:hypothetical protein